MSKIKCPNLTESNKNVVFIDNHLPGLESGDYTMTVTQTASDTSGGKIISKDKPKEDTFTTTKQFHVRGERFTLDPNAIDSVFPARNHQGEFSNCLPHVTFSAATFPWQRDLRAPKISSWWPFQGQSAQDGTPWIGLLAFAEGEAPATKPVTLGTFQSEDLPKDIKAKNIADKMLFYDFSKETGETDTDPCRVIDVPVELFNQLAPTAEELKYLAHVREVDTSNKAMGSTHYFRSTRPDQALDKATYAVAVGNRLLTTPGRYTVHLVSLENMGQYLPDSKGGSTKLANKTHIRLVSLHNWHFNVIPENQHLSDIIRALVKEPINLKLSPLIKGSKSDLIKGSKSDLGGLSNVLRMGYMPLAHKMRAGGNTVSWYRGPLAPYRVTDNIVAYPQQSADAWLRYDPDIAMFDLSYAAAWQLGRLLGLQSKAFATALYQWKCGKKQATISQLEQSILEEALSLPNTPGEAHGPLSQKALKQAVKLLKSHFKQLPNH